MQYNFDPGRRAEDKQMNLCIAIILALLTLMTVITVIVLCLPASAPVSNPVIPPVEDGDLTTTQGAGDTQAPNNNDYPSVGNFKNAPNMTGSTIYSSNAPGAIEGIKGKNAIVVDMSTNLTTHEKGADEKIQIASMTKVMTLITALDLIETNSEMYEQELIKQSYIDRLGGYQKAFKAGHNVYVIDLLYSLILQSGCDSALALADHLCGSETAFVAKMNEKAKEMGLESTCFTNCYGNDDGGKNYSTVREVGEIFMYALKNELAYKIITTKSFTYEYYGIKEYEEANARYCQSLVLDGIAKRNTGDVTVLGGKSGSDNMAGFCLVSFGQTDDGRKFLVVSAGDPTSYGAGGNSYDDSAYIYRNYVK